MGDGRGGYEFGGTIEMKNISTTSMLRGLLAVSILLGGAAHASGRHAKKDAEIKAEQTDLTRPGRKSVTTVPGLGARAFLVANGDAVQAMSDAQVALLEKLEAMTGESDPEKPDLLFRLAQAYEERARFFRFRARELDADIFAAQQR